MMLRVSDINFERMVVRRGSGADPAVVLAERDVADVEQAVLDLPVVAGELQQAGCSDEGGIEAGDGVDHLARAAILQLADALDAADRLEPRPRLVEACGQLRAHPDAPDLDAAVPLLDRLGADKIGGITPLGGLTRNGGDHVLRGERRRRREQSRLRARAGWL